MPRRGGLPLFCFVAVRLYFVAGRSGYQQGRINKGRSPQNCIERGCVSVRPSDAILRDDELICFAYANKIGAMRPLRWPRTTLGRDVAMVLSVLMVSKKCEKLRVV